METACSSGEVLIKDCKKCHINHNSRNAIRNAIIAGILTIVSKKYETLKTQ
jgi:Zn-finger protein